MDPGHKYHAQHDRVYKHSAKIRAQPGNPPVVVEQANVVLNDHVIFNQVCSWHPAQKHKPDGCTKQLPCLHKAQNVLQALAGLMEQACKFLEQNHAQVTSISQKQALTRSPNMHNARQVVGVQFFVHSHSMAVSAEPKQWLAC